MNAKSLMSKAAVLVAVAVVTGGLAMDALAQNRQPGNNQRQPNRQGGNQDGGGRGGFGGGRMGDMTAPAVTSRQIEKYAQMLNLSADQKAALKVLHDGYAEQARDTGEKARDEMQKLRDEMRDSEDREGLMQKMQTGMRKVREDRKKQDEAFTGDVKAILTPEQVEKWPAVERMQRREAGVRRGFVSGERIDLFALLEENRPSAEGQKSATPILSEYELELDRELIKRNEWQEKQFTKMGEMRQEGDFEGIQKLIEEGRQLDVKVRDVNRKYAKQIENALPEADKSAFATAFKKASFPDVYRSTQANEMLDAAAKFKDLTPEQVEGLKALRASHEKTVNPLNDKLAAAVEEAEMNFNIGQMGQGGRGFGRDDDSPAGKLRRERRDLDRATVESLKKILTPAQAEKLPKAEEGRGQRRQGGDLQEN